MFPGSPGIGTWNPNLILKKHFPRPFLEVGRENDIFAEALDSLAYLAAALGPLA